MENGKKYWFPAKPPGYGWGWGLPITWQGWAVFIGFFVLVIGGQIELLRFGMAVGIAWAVALAAALVGICLWKGEPPGSSSRPGGGPGR